MKNSQIEKYLIGELKLTGNVFISIFDKITKYDDVKHEFLLWLKTRKYDFDEPLRIESYTAKQIHELAPKLDGVGVYNFMVTLRDNPEKAKQYIKNNFVSE